MNRAHRLRLNKRLMFGTRFFIELKTINAVIQLFYLSRGLDLGQVVFLSLVWSITTFLSDVPSSFLADKFGRKKLIMAGIFLTSLSTFLLFFAQGFTFFALTYVIGAIGYSFFMGADHALLYDSLREVGEEKNANSVAGKYFSSQSLPKIIMPFVGSFIARGLLPWQFIVIIAIDLIGMVASFAMASFLTEPKVPARTDHGITDASGKDRFAIIKAGFRLIKSDKILLKMALNKITIFQASFVYWRIYQVLLKDAGMPTLYLGLIYTVFQSLLFFMFWNTGRLQKKVGVMNFILYPQILGLVAIVVSFLTTNLVLLFISCVVLLVIGVIRDPLFMAQMQVRIPSFNRATATSTLNVIKNISDLPILILVGYLASINVKYVLLVSFALFVIPLFWMRVEKDDLLGVDTNPK